MMPASTATVQRPPTATAPASRFRRLLSTTWRDWRIGAGVAMAAPLLYGVVAGWLTPRGPISAGEALTAMVTSLVVGAAAGLATRSRWAMLVAPIAFVVAFELTRLPVAGPTVDGLHLTTTYGLYALAVGRGIHALITLPAMVLGAMFGAALARRLRPGAARRRGWRQAVARYGRWAGTGLAAVAVLALAVGLARPASTDPILGPDGEPLAGSIAELSRVEIGGHDLAMMIRGHSVENPVLLFLAGGPGGTELGGMRRHLPQLEQGFVVVTFDQRGTGKSYDQLDPTSTLTLDSAISDVVEVTNYLRDRFGQDKIYLVGQSWGTVLGVLAVQQDPTLFRAFVGVGQMVSPRETDRTFYQDTLAWAEQTGNHGLVDTLTEIGPPPYDTILPYEPALSYEMDVYPYDHSQNSEGEGGFSENIVVEEYTLLEQIHNLGAMMDVFSVLYPQLQELDFRVDAASLDVPVYLVQGRHEARGRAELADEWFAMLEAPRKEMITFETSGHRPLFEQPDRFYQVMTEVVLPQTQPTG
jgi:pimeloyl-ACP methyl ester carboxylesterase